MLGLGSILNIISNGLSIWNNKTDPDKIDKKFNVALKKDWKKALDVAEDICMLVDEYRHLLPYKVQKKYKKLKQRFNDLD